VNVHARLGTFEKAVRQRGGLRENIDEGGLCAFEVSLVSPEYKGGETYSTQGRTSRPICDEDGVGSFHVAA
jgi:hypothetical protein